MSRCRLRGHCQTLWPRGRWKWFRWSYRDIILLFFIKAKNQNLSLSLLPTNAPAELLPDARSSLLPFWLPPKCDRWSPFLLYSSLSPIDCLHCHNGKCSCLGCRDGCKCLLSFGPRCPFPSRPAQIWRDSGRSWFHWNRHRPSGVGDRMNQNISHRQQCHAQWTLSPKNHYWCGCRIDRSGGGWFISCINIIQCKMMNYK